MLFDILRECKPDILSLDISFNQIGDGFMRQLGEFIHVCQHLEILKFADTGMTDKGVEILCEYLIGNTSLKELNVEENREITNDSLPHLLDIANRSCISKLVLWGTSLSEKNLQEIGQALRIPIEERQVPIKSNTKSAAKISVSNIT